MPTWRWQPTPLWARPTARRGNAVWRFQLYLAVGDKTADDLCARLEKQIPRCALSGGWTRRQKTKMGPLISLRAPQQGAGLTSTAGKRRGANLRVDGRSFSVQGHEKGYFVGPTLFDNAHPAEMTIYKEEIFGPVLSVVRVADYASAVDLINRHEYGNGSAIFHPPLTAAARAASARVQAGMVGD